MNLHDQIRLHLGENALVLWDAQYIVIPNETSKPKAEREPMLYVGNPHMVACLGWFIACWTGLRWIARRLPHPELSEFEGGNESYKEWMDRTRDVCREDRATLDRMMASQTAQGASVPRVVG